MNQLSTSFIEHIEYVLRKQGLSVNKISTIRPTYGGSINQTYCLGTNDESFFIKINDTRFPDMFKKEKLGLELLREFSSSLIIPKPLYVGEKNGLTFLLMEFISSSSPSKKFWTDFGSGLAQLHQNSASNFGLKHNNYIGSLIQLNDQKDNWIDFFVENRLMVQEKMAVDHNLLDQRTQLLLVKLYHQIEGLLPKESPSLLHGDLWSGNFMVSAKGNPVIIDPAIYYGHREMDIAMTHLFGGFAPEFYRAYQKVYPLEKGWKERIELCNLYPLLVHVNLFGSSYSVRVKNILKRIVN